jgi:hypothetical protein
MYVPLLREEIRVRGRQGKFVVFSADYSAETAEVVPASDPAGRRERVSFRSLLALWEGNGEDSKSGAAQ